MQKRFRTLPAGIVAALLIVLVMGGAVVSQAGKDVYIWILPEGGGVLYECGDTVSFQIMVEYTGNIKVEGEVTAELTLDGGRQIAKKTLVLGDSLSTIAGTLDEPGFLRCKVTYKKGGRKYHVIATAGFEPKNIKPSVTVPDDFDEFWRAGQEQLENIPLDLLLTHLPKYNSPGVKNYKFSFANINGTRCYGFLSIPQSKKPPYPVFVTVAGAGSGPLDPLAAPWAVRGALGLTVSVHDFDCGQQWHEIKREYRELTARTLYHHQGAPDRDAYYFRRAILGVNRAINYMVTRDDFDGEHVVFSGSSQGGGIGLMLAGMNANVTAVAANEPAMCEHSGGLAGRKPGWPQLLEGVDEKDKAAYLEMASYYDVVNFARRIKCPIIMSAGFNDETCPPSSVFSAYNVIDSPKRMFAGPNAGHQSSVGKFRSFHDRWVMGQLGLIEAVEPTKE